MAKHRAANNTANNSMRNLFWRFVAWWDNDLFHELQP